MPVPDVSVSVTEPGEQNVTGPEAESTGTGTANTDWVTEFEVAVQPPVPVTTTEYVSAAPAVYVIFVAPAIAPPPLYHW